MPKLWSHSPEDTDHNEYITVAIKKPEVTDDYKKLNGGRLARFIMDMARKPLATQLLGDESP